MPLYANFACLLHAKEMYVVPSGVIGPGVKPVALFAHGTILGIRVAQEVGWCMDLGLQWGRRDSRKRSLRSGSGTAREWRGR